MRRTFLSTGTPQTEDQRWYVLQNWRQDAVAIIDEAAVQRERVFYSPYGRVFGMVAGDTPNTGFDGSYGGTDDTAIGSWSGYDAYVDVDLDGDVDTTDASFTTNASMGWDVLSRDGSTVGYAGYVQDDFVATVSHVRHRAYKSDLGRWVQRDPAGYVDGANLYEYAMSSPLRLSGTPFRASNGIQPEDNCKMGVACRIIWSLFRIILHCYTFMDCEESGLFVCSGGPEDVVHDSASPGKGGGGKVEGTCKKCKSPSQIGTYSSAGGGDVHNSDCFHYQTSPRNDDKTSEEVPSGSVFAIRECMIRVKDRFNNCKMGYRYFGPNSNSFANCINEACLRRQERPTTGYGWAPGWLWPLENNCQCLSED